jgi:CTP synthase (UTP-ammonia lyase)
VVPHITDATQDWIQRVASVPVDDSKEEPDICIIELGGTVGDIESAPFIESMRQLRMRAGNKENFVSMVLGSQSSAADYSIATYPRYIRSSDSRRTKDQIGSTGDSRCAKRRIVPRSHRLPV